MLSKLIVNLQTRLAMNKAEEGQGLVEYALIIALIAVVVAAALLTLEDQITATFGEITTALTGGA